jgi:D-xylose transport system substrate-binding protein
MTKLWRVAAAGAISVLMLSACGDDNGDSGDSASASDSGSSSTTESSSGGGGVQVGVILPDTQSSARWETADKPLLTKAFADAGIGADIQNAQGDKAKMATIADAMIAEGIKVLILTNLDSPSAASIQAKAAAAGIKTIDYDRLTLEGKTDVYVSFDNVKVGELQGAGLVKCLGDSADAKIIEVNGSPTDNNATLFKQGYDSVLDPKYSEGWKKVGDKSVPDWDNAQAGVIFEQLLTAAGGDVDGVLVANDGMAQSVISVLKNKKLQVPVTGQDATVEGLQAVLAGDQCMTVYKAVADEAKAASDAAIAIINGQDPATTGTVNDGTRDVPSVLATPVAIYKDNVKDVIDDGYQTAADVCVEDVAAICTELGIS